MRNCKDFEVTSARPPPIIGEEEKNSVPYFTLPQVTQRILPCLM